jgi:hypothetical protein
MGSACCGQAVSAWVNAPAGITITGASSTGTVSNLNNGTGWVGGSFFSGGGTPWLSGGSLSDPTFSSPYWGFRVECAPGYSCTLAAQIAITAITLTASETSGPTLTPEGSGNLWYQNRPGEWIWNPPGDPWPLTVAASDPSGVCSMSADLGGHKIPGPSAVPQTSVWQQCPEPTWTPSGGASADTRDYIAGAGSLPLTIDATNMAQLATSHSETVHVDNDPVSVALTTPNDANPSVWVNHAVTVAPTATAGPSGIGGTNCSVDGAAAKAYPAGGATVNGDGVHTVSCTAWNQAVGPQGQPNTGTSALAVHIDEAPPSISFEPQNPADPTSLVLDAIDGESGLAGGSVEMAPVGSSQWGSLPTSVAGTQLSSRFDDAGRSGPYIFKATACDNVGNCATSSERLVLPLRIASDSEVSLTQIVNPVRRQVVLERVRVGWHWVTIRQGRELVRVKRGGHFRTIKVVKYLEPCTTRRVRTGPHRWRTERSCTPQVHVTRTLRVRYGRAVSIHGVCTTRQGVPLAGQPVRIFAAPDNHTGAFTPIANATTAADGSWTARVPPGPSRVIRAVTNGTATILPSSGRVTTIVPARVRLLQVWPRHVPWGATVHLVGRLLGGYLPPGGALVRLRIGYGSTYNTYGVEEHVAGDGRFSTVASFGPGDPSIVRTYWFQIASLPMGNYPYAPAASQRVPVIVGGDP